MTHSHAEYGRPSHPLPRHSLVAPFVNIGPGYLVVLSRIDLHRPAVHSHVSFSASPCAWLAWTTGPRPVATRHTLTSWGSPASGARIARPSQSRRCHSLDVHGRCRQQESYIYPLCIDSSVSYWMRARPGHLPTEPTSDTSAR